MSVRRWLALGRGLGLWLGLWLGLGLMTATAQASTTVVGVVSLDGDPRYAPRRVERAYPGHPMSRAAEGLRLGLADSEYELRTNGLAVDIKRVSVNDAADLPRALQELKAAKVGHVVADLPAPLLSALVQQASAALGPSVVYNTALDDDALRGAQCARHLLHTYPSRAMLSDALVQYLVAQRWTNALALNGPEPADALQSQALARAAKRFGLKLIEQKPFKLSGDPRERDLGNVRLLTAQRNADVVVVNDAHGEFARTVPYATNVPRPVAGAAGLSALAWHTQFERFGAPQLTRRFWRQSTQPMVGQDWAAWIAGRAIAAALLAQPKGTPADHLKALRSGSITLDGFKGKQLSFRSWDGQLRQPVFLTHPSGVVTMAPMEGVLHPTEPMDTLGMEAKESPCQQRL
jgi:ABC transporter substrate binding protein (PQQ-dependent alcohol dehydrogenase system)